MLQKQLSEIFRTLAQGRRSYGSYVNLDHESEIAEGLRLMKLQAQSVIADLEKRNDIPPSGVTFITLQNDNEALVAWFFSLQGKAE